MRQQAEPDIYDFTDPYLYLASQYQYAKQTTGLHLKELAIRSGFRSVSILSMIFRRQRQLTPNAAVRLADAFELSTQKKDYLVALSVYQRARVPSEKAEAYNQVIRLQELHKGAPVVISQNRFLAIWYYPVILVMVGSREFQWNAVWIAERLGRRVTAEQVKVAVGDLLNLGLLRIADGKLERTTASLTTAEDVNETAIKQYHAQMLSLAQESLELPSSQREVNGLTISVREDQVAVAKERIRKFRREMNCLLSRGGGEAGTMVYQLNIQMFPLTVPSSQGVAS